MNHLCKRTFSSMVPSVYSFTPFTLIWLICCERVRWWVQTLVVVGMSWVTSFRLCRWGTSSNHRFTWGLERTGDYTRSTWRDILMLLKWHESKPHMPLPISLNSSNTVWWEATMQCKIWPSPPKWCSKCLFYRKQLQASCLRWGCFCVFDLN